MVSVEGVKCPSFHTKFLNSFKQIIHCIDRILFTLMQKQNHNTGYQLVFFLGVHPEADAPADRQVERAEG